MKKKAGFLPSIYVIACIILIIAMSVSTLAINTVKQINAVYRDIKLNVNGVEIDPRDVNGNSTEPFITEPFISGDSVYVPIRAVSEALGMDVIWDSDTSTVYISAKTPSPDCSSAAPSKRSKTVEVATAEELVKGIAPDTCITLKAGIYDLSTVVGVENPYVYWQDDVYGSKEKTLVISRVDGLTLQAAPDADVEIVTPWSFAWVLTFSNCSDVSLIGITAGHSLTYEYQCDAGVVEFENSRNISIDDCLFYGSGSIGISLKTCNKTQITDTTVTDCSLRAVGISRSQGIVFTGCKFVDNRAYGCVVLGYSSSAEFFDCEISGNKNLAWDLIEFNDDVLFERCVFRDNALAEGRESAEFVFNGKKIRLRDCEIEKGNFSGYWDSGVVDLGGNDFK